jgi:hypothetical protein
MRTGTPIAWFGGAGIIFLAGLITQSADVMIVAAAPAAVALGTLLFGWKQNLRGPDALPEPDRMQQLEERLRLTENELESAARDLAAIKQQREFDEQLQLTRSKPTE